MDTKTILKLASTFAKLANWQENFQKQKADVLQGGQSSDWYIPQVSPEDLKATLESDSYYRLHIQDTNNEPGGYDPPAIRMLDRMISGAALDDNEASWVFAPGQFDGTHDINSSTFSGSVDEMVNNLKMLRDSYNPR